MSADETLEQLSLREILDSMSQRMNVDQLLATIQAAAVAVDRGREEQRHG